MNNTIKLGNFISEYSIRNRTGDDIPVYSVTNKEGFCRDYFSKDVASQDRSTYKIVPRGCFAYNPSRINVGSVDWQRKEDRVIVSPLYVVFSVSKGLDQQYLYYYLKSEKCLYYIKELASGSVRDNLKLSMLKEFTIPNITLEEQRKAVMVLEQTDRLIVLQERQMTVLDELVKSRFVEMFGEPVSNPKGWPVQNFEDMSVLITDGEHSTPRRSERGIYLLSARNVLNHTLQLDDVDFIDEEEYCRIARRVTPQEGDVLISCSGSIGRCCVVPANLRFQMVRSTALIRFNEEINPIFAEWLITSEELQRQIAQSATQSSQANLFQGKIQKLHGYVPPKVLQDEFATFVAEVDKSKLAVKQSLEKLETLKKSLMQQYFG